MTNFTGTLLNTTMANNMSDNFTEDVNMTLMSTSQRPQPRGTPYPPGYYADTMETLWKVIPPIIIVWGIVGNILTFLVLVRQMRKKVSSTTMYLMALAFSDCIILLCGPLRNFINFNWEKDVRTYSDSGCRMQLYFTYASVHMSSWLLVAVTMERVLSVVLPHKVKLGCTPKIAGVVIFTIFVCVFGLNICVPVMNGHDTFVETYSCAPTREEYQNFRDDIWGWIDFCVAFAVPFLFLLVGNIIIIYHLFKSRKSQRKMSSSKAAGSKLRSVSVLLILLCFVFFATMTPLSIFHVYQPYRFEEILKMDTYKEAWYAYHYLTFQHAIVNLVGYTNASFNFIMYVLSGSKFRAELKAIICCCCKRSVSAGSSTTKTKTTTSGNTSRISQTTSTKGSIAYGKDTGNLRSDLRKDDGTLPKGDGKANGVINDAFVEEQLGVTGEEKLSLTSETLENDHRDELNDTTMNMSGGTGYFSPSNSVTAEDLSKVADATVETTRL